MSDAATVLALNPGSSSLKVAVRTPEPVFARTVERIGPGGIPAAVDEIAAALGDVGLRPAVVSHRVVHGGPVHHRPTEIDDALLVDLTAAIPLAPLHLPTGIEAIVHARGAWPSARHVACFDTGFHHDLPPWSRRLPVAAELERAGVRRYGFHGLSVQSILRAHPGVGDVVIAHLGSGCSVTAVGADGRPRHTTMSLTPTGGMMSATRTGDLDPEIVLYLIAEHGYTVDRLRELMDRQSGLAGLAGGRHDLRDLLAAEDPDADLAVEAFVRSAAASIAGCATALDAWDTLVFTGGVGAHAAQVRERIRGRLGSMSPPGLRVLVVEADEESELDLLARALLARPAPPAPRPAQPGGA